MSLRQPQRVGKLMPQGPRFRRDAQVPRRVAFRRVVVERQLPRLLLTPAKFPGEADDLQEGGERRGMPSPAADGAFGEGVDVPPAAVEEGAAVAVLLDDGLDTLLH